MMWIGISVVARRYLAPFVLGRIVLVLLGWGTASLEELLALSVFVGFVAGDEVGVRGAIHALAWRDSR